MLILNDDVRRTLREWTDTTSSAKNANAARQRIQLAELNLAKKFLRNLSAVLGDLLDDLFVQPDIHCSRVLFVPGIVQFCRQLFAGRKAAINSNNLH